MPDAAVYVIPDADFDDWIVRTDAGDEVAHYATREAAELVAQQIALERTIDLVVHLPDGRTTRKKVRERMSIQAIRGIIVGSAAASRAHACGMLSAPCHELGQGHEPRSARDFRAVAQQHQGWDTLDRKALHKLRRGIGIHFDQPNLWLELAGGLRENRRHRLTGTAPGRPEIDQQRNVAMGRMPVEPS
jgi:hypothetical protein